jgi:hypothetical protein|eukprot:SAG25_NODE_190_length_12277_cov_10.004927_6_plen_126_part_00
MPARTVGLHRQAGLYSRLLSPSEVVCARGVALNHQLHRDQWRHEYSLPLGAPTSAAVVRRHGATSPGHAPGHAVSSFRRVFRHARVELNITGAGASTSVSACVCWEGGWITGPDQPCGRVCDRQQ